MKKAFTLLEIVFVIVAIGIISATVIPNITSNKLQEAAIQLVSHIRYTQHLAMIDDRYDNSNSKWYKERWSIRFNKGAHSNYLEAYTIFADKAGTSRGNADLIEIAIDPLDPEKLLSGGITGVDELDINHDDFIGYKKMNLGMTYGVINVSFNGGCSEKSFSFDHLGRAINGRLKDYMQSYENNDLIKSRCNIILESSDNNITIAIESETGYTHIL